MNIGIVEAYQIALINSARAQVEMERQLNEMSDQIRGLRSELEALKNGQAQGDGGDS